MPGTRGIMRALTVQPAKADAQRKTDPSLWRKTGCFRWTAYSRAGAGPTARARRTPAAEFRMARADWSSVTSRPAGSVRPEATFLVVVMGAGALAGAYARGRFADRLLRRGHIRARILIPMACLLVISAFLGPASAVTSVAIALPLLITGAFLLGAPQPPLDAARLDIMPAQLRDAPKPSGPRCGLSPKLLGRRCSATCRNTFSAAPRPPAAGRWPRRQRIHPSIEPGGCQRARGHLPRLPRATGGRDGSGPVGPRERR